MESLENINIESLKENVMGCYFLLNIVSDISSLR
jgi:hypothetical protein